MDDLGANNRNGTTNEDRTNFFEDVPVSALERTLYLEADRMGFLAAQINDAMLERERGVVQNEKRQGENQPYGRVFDTIVERMYPGVASVQLADHRQHGRSQRRQRCEDVKDWYASYYGPNNCVLSLAGDITPERALELVKKYFGGIPPGPPVDRARAVGAAARREHARPDAGPRAAGAHLSRVSRAGVARSGRAAPRAASPAC